MPDDFREDEEWEGGPLDEGQPRDVPAPEHLPEESGGALQDQLDKLDSEDDFAFASQPEIADPGISPIPQPDNQLDQNLAELEADEPFEFSLAESAGEIPQPSEPAPVESGELPEEDPLTPPATLAKFYEAGGKIQGGLGALPNLPAPSQDGPVDPLKQYLDSSYSLTNVQTDYLIDASNQIDVTLERLERGRL